MIKHFPAEVYMQKIYCDKCGFVIEKYKKLLDDNYLIKVKPEDVRYEFACENCGNTQIENTIPTFVVKGEIPNKIDLGEERQWIEKSN